MLLCAHFSGMIDNILLTNLFHVTRELNHNIIYRENHCFVGTNFQTILVNVKLNESF